MKTRTLSTKAILAAAFTLVLALAALVGCTPSVTQEDANTNTVPVISDITAEGWDAETSTPVILHFEGDTEEGEHLDFYHALTSLDSAENAFDVFCGTYHVSIIAPINADGSTYVVPDGMDYTITGDLEDVRITATIDLVAEPSADEVNAALDAVKTAARAGDDSFTEDIVANAEANAQVRLDAIAKAEAEAKAAAEAEAQAKAEAEAAEAAAAAQASNSGSSKGSGNSGSNSGYTGGGNSGTSSNGGGSSAPAQSAPAPTPAPSAPSGSTGGSNGGHVHEWDSDGYCWCGTYKGGHIG